MTIGPLQLMVIGFEDDTIAPHIGRELKAVRRRGTIRVFDFLYVVKHADGTFDAKHLTDLKDAEKETYGTVLHNLIGLGEDGVQQLQAGDLDMTSIATAETEYGLEESDIENVANLIPANSSAILILFEHHWAIGLKEAVAEAGGKVLAQGLINPESLKMTAAELTAFSAGVARVEQQTLEEAMAIMEEAKAEKAEAEAETAVAQETMADAREQAEDAVLEAEEVGAMMAAEAVLIQQAHKKDEADLAEAMSATEEARQVAIDEAVIIIAEARAAEEAAIMRAAAVYSAAAEMEARAVMRALNTLVLAEIVEETAVQDAIDAIVMAEIVEEVAAQRVYNALALGSGEA